MARQFINILAGGLVAAMLYLQSGTAGAAAEYKVVTASDKGTYYAIEDVCTHDDGPLAEGDLNGCIISCPRHGATFDIQTGKVLTPPALVDVQSYDVQIQGENIQVRAR